MSSSVPLTRVLASYAVRTEFEGLPAVVQHEAGRAFLNWIGVALGGSREDAVTIAARMVAAAGGASQATIIGQGTRTDPASASFVNCIASSVLAYDDAHLPSVAHPSGPAAAALFALAQTKAVTGHEFLNALVLGIEVQCRVANMLALPPSTFHPALYVNGFSGPIGVAAAAGRLLGLDEQRMIWAVGLAASQASGFRSTHGTMTAHLRPGLATRAGVMAALLALEGFDCTDNALEAPGGFLDVYAPGADPERAVADLGQHHEMLANRYKPYPCGIVIHPVIDACLEIHSQWPDGVPVGEVRLEVNPLVLRLTGKREPRTTLESHVSVFHWAAAALLDGRAGLAETHPDRLADERIMALRSRIVAVPDPELGKGEARAEVWLPDATSIQSHVRHARGSLERAMSDDELEAKVRELISPVIAPAAGEEILDACRDLPDVEDVGRRLGSLIP